jgi:hypothetical protein
MTVVAPRRARRSGGSASSALLWLGLGVLALAGLWSLIGAWEEGLSGGRDFVQDYAAIVKIGQGRNPYEPYNDVTQQVFGGPPHRGALYSFHAPTSLPLLLWLLPFALAWGYLGAFLAWGVVSVLALWSICWLTLRAPRVPHAAIAGLLAALALISLPAIRECFEEGQLNVVVAAGMVGCWAARRSGRPGLAGVLLAGAFALKPIPGLFFLYYLWRRDWHLLLVAALTLIVLLVLGVGLAGIDGTRLWATVNYPSHAAVWPGYPDNASVRGFFTRFFGPSEWRPRPAFQLPYVSMVLWVIGGALLTLAALRVARVRAGGPTDTVSPAGQLLVLAFPPPIRADDPRGDLEVAVLTVLTLLVTPIVWPHYYVVLVMPVAAVATYLGRLVLDGTVWASRSTPAYAGQAELASGLGRAPAQPYDLRRRVLPTVALLLLTIATAFLANAQYVEPYRGVGGQLLIALLTVYAAALIALGWSVRDQGRASNPALVR